MVKLGSVPAPRQKAGGLPYRRCGCLSHFLGVNKSSFETFDIPWGIQPHKIHSDSFCSTFKGIGPKNRTGNNVLHDRINQYLLGAKTVSSHAHKTGSWNLFGFFFAKFPKNTPCPFGMGVPLRNPVKLNLRLGSDKNKKFIFLLSFTLQWKSIFTRELKPGLFFSGTASFRF